MRDIQTVRVLEPIYVGFVENIDGYREFIGALFDVRLVEIRSRPETKTFKRRWMINGSIMSNGSRWYGGHDKTDNRVLRYTRSEITDLIIEEIVHYKPPEFPMKYQTTATPPAPSEPEAKEERTMPYRRRRQCLL